MRTCGAVLIAVSAVLGQPATVIIPGTQGSFTPSGVFVTAGQPVSIVTTGLITTGSANPATADGWGNPHCGAAPALGLSENSLLGRIREASGATTLLDDGLNCNGVGVCSTASCAPGTTVYGPGFIGSSFSTTAPVSGEIEFAVNDGSAWNNGGQWTTAVNCPVAGVVPAISSVVPDGGPQSGGTVFTITGSNLDTSCTLVTLEYTPGGSQPVQILSGSSGTSITCVTPAMLAVGPLTIRVTNPAGWAQTSYFSSYKPSFYGNATPGTGGSNPVVEIDWANSTSTTLEIRATGALPGANAYLAANTQVTGYPLNWTWSSNNGVWMNIPTSYFGVDAAVLTQLGLFQHPAQLSLFANLAINNYTPGLPLVANASGVATHQVDMPLYGLVPSTGSSRDLFLQVYAEDPNGGFFPINEIWGIAVSSGFALALPAPVSLATLGATAVAHIGGVYLTASGAPLPASLAWDGANNLAQWAAGNAPSVTSVSAAALQYFVGLAGPPSLYVSGSPGLQITYYGP